MSKNEQAAAFLRSVVHNHVGSNIRSYSWKTWCCEVSHNSLGGIRYLSPVEGKVVDQNDDFLLVKAGPKEFVVVLKELLTEVPAIGAKVGLKFYELRRFDGTLADGSEDAVEGGFRSIMLTGAQSYFPVKWDGRYIHQRESLTASHRMIQNPYLRDLITQMETIRTADGLRRVVNVIIDAGATELDFVDPPEQDSAEIPPAISFRVANTKLLGKVTIDYDRAMDYYRVHVERVTSGRESPAKESFTDIDFEQLGPFLEELIDDRSWRQVQVTVLRAAPKQKKAAQEAVA
jgi:hypothetical protein